ncbi:hypothetical protein SK128_001031 [Halocaridina rubra]|uniref:Condensation domain-containing protein n=1 Tax=Halocaridina rubra TaxID=373956 RepID=A0AAN8X4E4_HALRR
MMALQSWPLRGRRCGFQIPRTLLRSTFQRLKSTQKIKWLWEADKTVQDYHLADLQCTRRVVVNVTLKSVKPVHQDQVWQTLVHMQQKIPALRTCILYKDDKMLFCQPSNLQIDFRVEKGSVDPSEVAYRASNERFRPPEYGQWRAIFITNPANGQHSHQNTEDYPYQYNIIFTSHHGINDGSDTFFIIRFIVQTLNDVIAGNPIDDEEYTHFSYNKEIGLRIDSLKERLMNDSQFFKEVESSIQSPESIPLILQAYPRPRNVVPSSKNIVRVIDSQVIEKFQNKAKEVGVTFSSSFVSVMNAAVMELVKEKGITRDSYDIASHIYTDHRRYMKPSEKHVFGIFSAPMSYISKVDKHIRDGFWDYCKQTHEELQTLLHKGTPLEQKAFRELTDAQYDYVNRIRPASHDYTITSVGNFPSFFGNADDLVQISNFQGRCNIHNSCNSTLLEVFTVSNKCYSSLDYATNYFEDETIKKLSNKIFSLMKYFSQ